MRFSTFCDIMFDWLSLLGWSKTWAHPVVQTITEKLNLLICYLPSSFSSSFSSRSFSIDSMKELVALSFCFLLIIKILQILNQCQKKRKKIYYNTFNSSRKYPYFFPTSLEMTIKLHTFLLMLWSFRIPNLQGNSNPFYRGLWKFFLFWKSIFTGNNWLSSEHDIICGLWPSSNSK